MSDRVPMTKTGEDRLREELKKLKSEDRPRVIAAIADAREHGDLKENAEYHAAREQQSFIEGRIQEIEGKLSVAQVIDVTTMENTGKVIFGTTVHLVNMETDEEGDPNAARLGRQRGREEEQRRLLQDNGEGASVS